MNLTRLKEWFMAYTQTRLWYTSAGEGMEACLTLRTCESANWTMRLRYTTIHLQTMSTMVMKKMLITWKEVS